MNLRKAAIIASVLTLSLSCRRDDPAKSGPIAAPLRVSVITLQFEPVAETSDYLAQLVSRRHVAIYPQVVGNIGAIFVKPGDVVKQGHLLLQIDLRKERANLLNQLAAREERKANLDLARANEKRAQGLFHEGLISRQQFDQDESQRQVAEHELKAQQASISAQQTQLAYYRITAPFDGMVGDIPVKLGEFVTQETKLTTVDQNAQLEAYVNVPAEKANLLNEHSRMQILGNDRKQLTEVPIDFVAQETDVENQSVLIKASFSNQDALRALQIIHTRVIWNTRPALRVPISAITRQSGRFFVFAIEAGPKGKFASRQKLVDLGELDDNQYTVLSGLGPGERIITTQIQKLRNDMPVEIQDLAVAASVQP